MERNGKMCSIYKVENVLIVYKNYLLKIEKMFKENRSESLKETHCFFKDYRTIF